MLIQATPGISQYGGQATDVDPTQIRSLSFVPAEQLPFDVAQVVQRAIADWEATNPLGTCALDESAGGFIAAEMDHRASAP